MTMFILDASATFATVCDVERLFVADTQHEMSAHDSCLKIKS